MTDTAGPTFDQAGHIRALEAQIAQLRQHETIRAKTIADHQARLTAADTALAEVAQLRGDLEVERALITHLMGEVRKAEAARAAVALERDEAINDKEHLRDELAEVRRQRDYAEQTASQRGEHLDRIEAALNGARIPLADLTTTEEKREFGDQIAGKEVRYGT